MFVKPYYLNIFQFDKKHGTISKIGNFNIKVKMASNLVVSARDVSGKRAIRKLRHDGFVPGVIYGDNKEPELVSVREKELLAECYTLAFLGNVIEAKIGSKTEKFLPKEIEFDPVTDRPIHVDFLRVSKNSKVKVSIAVEFVNEDKCPGLKKGGVINIVVHRLECLCSPDSIPEKLIVDLSGKDIGESFLLENLNLPDGVVPANPERDSVIATLVGARIAADDATPGESSEKTEEGAAA
ncbi:MAG: 50S ribosomal protein L25/general stress protein Ctc [Alphaproteobacteria bacterium]|nr:50S ribosomal protein L25/general stress protein Ctc [Alphaproteobacteria bacterium]